MLRCVYIYIYIHNSHALHYVCPMYDARFYDNGACMLEGTQSKGRASKENAKEVVKPGEHMKGMKGMLNRPAAKIEKDDDEPDYGQTTYVEIEGTQIACTRKDRSDFHAAMAAAEALLFSCMLS